MAAPLGGGMQVWDEWKAGWQRADSEDDGYTSPRPHPEWPAEVQRGYRDWWTHPQGHEKRVLEVDYRQYRGKALEDDPPLRTRGQL